ncbi:MAG: DNA polymerase IV [Conexivisphaerales archaeon]
MQQPGRIILAVDMDYFYAQCEELRHPEYSTKPIVVGMFSGRTEISGAVATSNYPARKIGVKSGMPLASAIQLMKDIDHLLVKADFDYYESVSAKIMKILREYSSKFVQESIDEAFLDITDRVDGDYDRALELAAEIKSKVMKETGIKCSIGIGPNRLIAKMACDASKPNGLMMIRPEQIQSFFKGKPVDSIYGIGGKTAERLKQMGIDTIDQLSKLPLHTLQNEFGNKLGLYYYLAARGIDETPLEEKEKDQIGRMMILKQDSRDVNYIIEALSSLIPEIKKELEEKNLAFRTVSIVLIDTHLKPHTREKTLKTRETDCSAAIDTARELVQSLLQNNPDITVRRAGITFSSLSNVEGQKNITDFLS